jgi:hypothetical protein
MLSQPGFSFFEVRVQPFLTTKFWCVKKSPTVLHHRWQGSMEHFVMDHRLHDILRYLRPIKVGMDAHQIFRCGKAPQANRETAATTPSPWCGPAPSNINMDGATEIVPI